MHSKDRKLQLPMDLSGRRHPSLNALAQLLMACKMLIYDRTGCESSGTFIMYVANLLTMNHVGVRLGFNEKDALESYRFRGTGKVLARLLSLNLSKIAGTKSTPPQRNLWVI